MPTDAKDGLVEAARKVLSNWDDDVSGYPVTFNGMEALRAALAAHSERKVVAYGCDSACDTCYPR
jgi:hypothetical protein